ncbi:MAG: hypothetical protein ABIP97_06080 [Chthoniobacterales bacterium]
MNRLCSDSSYTMKPTRIYRLLTMLLLWSAVVSLCACRTVPRTRTIRYEVVYYDRNKDGIADREFHHAVGMADADFVLVDTDFKGRYNKRLLIGYTVITKKVNIPAPKMESKGKYTKIEIVPLN